LVTDSPGRELFSGLFDLGYWAVLGTTVAALFVAAACSFSSWLVLEYGDVRFGVPKRKEWTSDEVFHLVGGFPVDRMGVILGLLYLASAATVIGGTVSKTATSQGTAPVSAVIWGVGIFLVLVLLAAFLWHRFGRREGSFVAELLAFTRKGYMPELGHPRLLPGHGFGIWVALLSHAVYLFFGYRWLFPDPEHVWGPRAASLVCVLLLLALLCWIFGALAFFFDGYRLPVLVPFFVLVLTAAQWPQSDHFFNVKKLEPPPPGLFPFDVLNAGKDQVPGDAAIVVCASGGGIQAEAWTAKVLISLRADAGPKFTRALRLISSVSGGSVGALQFLGAWQHGDVEDSRLSAVFAASIASVLDEVAQGLIYPDLWRLALPFFVLHAAGRGQAQEKAWATHATFPEALSAWRDQVRAGMMPAVIFNSTVNETGERLMITDIDFARAQGVGAGGEMRTLRDLYKGTGLDLDVSPLTGARLSATFPYVSPAARADFDLPRNARYHMVDGGYYDNLGISSAIEFLEQAVLRQAPGSIRKILVIQIRDRTGAVGPGSATRSARLVLSSIGSGLNAASHSR
jgi:hypothetical protein